MVKLIILKIFVHTNYLICHRTNISDFRRVYLDRKRNSGTVLGQFFFFEKKNFSVEIEL